MKQLLNEFYSSLKDISAVNSDLNEKRDELKIYTTEFNTLVQSKTVDKKIIKQNKEMAELLDETIGLIKKSSQTWIDNFDQMLEKEKFRSDLANYFIIIIFGKVKAGKSSLGNFIASHKLPEQKVEFFKYDEAGKKQDIKKLEEIDEDSFDTNNLECTVEIQGFKLDGMAWIDTPGLGSMVKENGDLAKEYIQSADYIIYPTSSDSPLQQDEREQLKELFEQNKKVTICITKSDRIIENSIESDEDFKKYENFINEYQKSTHTIEENKRVYRLNKAISNEFKKIKNMNNVELIEITEEECEGKYYPAYKVIENKPYLDKKNDKEGRKAQEDNVKSEINNIIQDNKSSILGNIFSISTHTANKGIEDNNPMLFENSNMPKFYELITEVVKEKSKKLKEDTPYDGLKSFIDNSILGNESFENGTSIKSIKKSLTDLDEKINESIERFEVLQKNANSDLSSEVESTIAEYVCKIDKNNSKEIFAEIDAELNKKVSKAIQKNIYEIFADFDTTLKSLTTTMGSDEFEIKDKFKTIEYTTEERNEKIGSGLLGLISTLASFALAPVTGGASLAVGAASGMAGGYIGGKIGRATGTGHTEKIKVGDNKEEIIQQFKASRLENYESFAKNMYSQMQNTFFTPLQNTSLDITSDLNRFEEKIKNIL
ncbi:MAG TPA: hypothetical protein EYG73_03800 [Arcobacter sp.]|nr:hypothetical protein [Arcobacter sp.]